MFGDWGTSLIIIMMFIVVMMWWSQQKFKDKVLCIFHTQKLTRIEKWVPMDARHVKFGNKKKGDVGMYYVDPACFELYWYDRGVNKLFPCLTPSQDFYWYSPYPVDPRTGKPSWHTPEFRYAAWQEHQYRAFARASEQQGMGASRKQSAIERFMPLIILGVALITLLLLWQLRGAVMK